MFVCNCADTLIRNTICKHIHLVARFNQQNFDHNTFQSVQLHQQGIHDKYDNESSLVKNLQDTRKLSDIAVIRTELHTQLLHLANQLDLVQDKDTLYDVSSYITSAMNLIKLSQHPGNLLSVTRNELCNKLL